MSQKEFDELIQEIEDMLLNKDIDINNSPQLKNELENIISSYIEQSISKIEQENKEYYQKRSQQAVYEIKQEIISDFQSQSKSVNQRVDVLNHKVDEHSKIAQKISNDSNSLNEISRKMDNLRNYMKSAQQSTHKMKKVSMIFKSNILSMTYIGSIIGIIVGFTMFALEKIF